MMQRLARSAIVIECLLVTYVAAREYGVESGNALLVNAIYALLLFCVVALLCVVLKFGIGMLRDRGKTEG